LQALPDFLRSGVSGTGPLGLVKTEELQEQVAGLVQKTDIIGTNFAGSRGRLVGIVRFWTKTAEFASVVLTQEFCKIRICYQEQVTQ
jgi:hypothetical protein